MRGRKPKSAAVQLAAGDPRDRGKNKLQEMVDRAPTPTRGLPACPRHLRGRARAAWNFWSRELMAMGLDRRCDAQMLEGACVGYERACLSDLQLQAEGLTVKETALDKDGNTILLRIKKHPAVDVSNAAWRQLRAFCSEFGLSPVSRNRVLIDKADADEDDLMEILMRPRAPRPVSKPN
ncbi:MAG: phage terminase small subunit P27 family [Candidatus Sulfotelmatobacter sp.]